MQMVCALGNSEVSATKKKRAKMWGMVSSKLLSEFEEIEKFMLPAGNFKNYREQYNKSILNKTKIVPYLPVHLRDLIYINDGNSDLFEDLPPGYSSQENHSIVNFEKIQLIGKEISQLLIIRDLLLNEKYDCHSTIYKHLSLI